MEPLNKLSKIEQWRKQRAEKRKEQKKAMRKIKTRSYARKLSNCNGTERDTRGSKQERKLSKTWPKEKERKRVRKKAEGGKNLAALVRKVQTLPSTCESWNFK